MLRMTCLLICLLLLTILQSKVTGKAEAKHAKYAIGFFSNVSMDVGPANAGGFEVKYILTENPKLKGEIQITGNEELSDNKLKGEITLKPGDFYRDDALWKTKHNILALYDKEGFYFANVDAEVTPVSDSREVSVIIEVKEGERIKIAQVNFTGNEHATYKSLRKVMEMRKGKRFNDEALKYDILRLKEYYHDRGFMYVKIDEPERRFTEDKTGLIIEINIEEGPQLLIGSYKIEFKRELEKRPLSEQKIFSMLELVEGDIFNKTLFWQDRDKIKQTYNDKGYLMAEIIPDARYDEENTLIYITLKISEGTVMEIGDVIIEGLTKTKEGVIRRELDRLKIKRGRKYNVQNVRKATRTIYRIGSFIRGVNFNLDETEVEDRKNLRVRIIESPHTGLFNLWGGYDSYVFGDDGSDAVSLFGGVRVGNENLSGRAYQLQVEGILGRHKKRKGQIRFSLPWIFNTPTRLNLSLYSIQNTRHLYSSWSSQESYDWAIKKHHGGSITHGGLISQTIEASVRFRAENGFTEWQGSLSEDSTDKTSTGWRETRSITAHIYRDTRDYRGSLFTPVSGLLNSLSFEYSGGILGAENDFQKYSHETRWYRKIWKNTVLVARLKTGYLKTNIWNRDKSAVNENQLGLLYFERYLLGGIGSVRGYEDQTINPDTGEHINPYYGGNKMFYCNLEYRITVVNLRLTNLTLIAFYDMGQTWNEETNFGNFAFNPKKGIGIGGRLEIPQMGIVLRLEYGYDFDREKRGGKLHFAINRQY